MRAFGEWEEQELLFLALPHYNSDWQDDLTEIMQSYVELVNVVSKYQKVVLISPNQKDFDYFFKDIPNVSFYEIDTDDTWIRDYGAIDVENAGRIISYDFTFNAWGGKFQSSKDNLVNAKLFKSFKGELRKVNMILEGGSIEFNGFGTMITTTTCLLNKNRNANLSKAELENEFRKLFGIHTLIWLEHGFIKGDDTDSHVDTLARFINRNTIAYSSCDDVNDIHYDELKKMEDELKKTGFNLVALPIPSPLMHDGRRLAATYANFIFVNGALIVPTYNDKNDQIVLERLKQACPNKDVIGIDARVFIRQNGSLHCSSQNRFLGAR
ncbi:agmatine deiminase family protein [Campylobacter geochelonis]|uniref:Orotidine 5'-phosphate decarboxylase n=1 Tax=Campylobacter geochelonis TaxID=1780362 RepID=A0A128EJ09_9BACT|nr:agmatine deiminase family protein [Campylobacter geochelonis]QKF71590.1 agmatine deiminase [Campylobacter geochelonis]CZE48641.1 orotidine 5'-phosphate decarboxylase [Campylobacter geochelonis]CZE48756.1 orotidine 5'-phosphate decarboxylase [Campylobacter geochelonis]CZE51006.1 orotidine 5'-phosphate decarboxylase [Campylobacter geochelonis]